MPLAWLRRSTTVLCLSRALLLLRSAAWRTLSSSGPLSLEMASRISWRFKGHSSFNVYTHEDISGEFSAAQLHRPSSLRAGGYSVHQDLGRALSLYPIHTAQKPSLSDNLLPSVACNRSIQPALRSRTPPLVLLLRLWR